MEKIDQKLFQRLRAKLQVSRARVYQIIDDKVRQAHLPRDLAAIAVASDHGLGISRYASEEQLATLREAAKSGAPPSVIVPRTAEAAPRRRASGGRRKSSADTTPGK